MFRLILPDEAMPRTIFWHRFLEALNQTRNCDFLVPEEDLACETNWPAYGNPAAAYMRGSAHESKTINGYLDKVVDAARNRSTERLLVVNMNPFFRLPVFLREIENIYVADGSLAMFERTLNPRTVSLPALPIITGAPSGLSFRTVLASFRGVPSHPIRRKLASIAEGEKIVVNLVERDNHSGKINALNKTTDAAYEALLQRSIFAFVPRGDSRFSYRLLEVMSFGCIPIVLSDGWVLPFDRTLDWNAFSLSFNSDSISGIPEALGNLRDDEIAQMSGEVERVYNADFKDLHCIVQTLVEELDSFR
jgi:hypothetical protein